MTGVTQDGWFEECSHCGERALVRVTADIQAIWHEDKEVTVSVEVECHHCGSLLSDQSATIEFWDLKEEGVDNGKEV